MGYKLLYTCQSPSANGEMWPSSAASGAPGCEAVRVTLST